MPKIVRSCSRWFVAIVIVAVSGAAVAADDDAHEPASLDAVLAEMVADGPVPGAAVVVVEGQRIVAAGCAGVRKRGHDAKVTLDDRWHLGSCTKAMTATMIEVLIEQGRLPRDLTIAQALPDLAEHMHDKFRDVTLEQLLSNRGGVPGEAPGVWRQIALDRSDPVQDRRKMARLILSRGHGPVVGEYEYSNFGYAIAGHMAETVTGTPWEQLMREVLFEPLGMETAGFGVPWDDPAVTDPWGHHVDGAPVMPGPMADNPPAIGPAGTVHASITDWAKFISVHLTGERADVEALGLPRERVVAMHRPRMRMSRDSFDGYAAGWIVTRRPWAEDEADDDPGGGRVLMHAGSNTMFFAVAWLAPERDLAVLATTNQGGPEAERLLDRVVAKVLMDHLARGADAQPRPGG